MSGAARDPKRRGRESHLRIGTVELTKLGATRFDWRDPYHFAIALSWPRFIALVLSVHFGLNMLFGGLYAAAPGAIANARPGSYLDGFFFSVETLATVGYGVMAPQTLYGHIVSAVEIVIGMGFAAVTTGLLFVRFSRPRPRILYARTVVITRRNGRPTLMLRLANGRVGTLTNASAHVTALLAERTQEGQFYRLPQELRLERSRVPIFALTWTLMHPIDEHSPLQNYDAERLEREQVRLFLSVEAHDPVLAASVADLKTYSFEHIQFGMRFSDAVSTDGQGHTTVNIDLLHAVEPDTGLPEIAVSDGEATGMADSAA